MKLASIVLAAYGRLAQQANMFKQFYATSLRINGEQKDVKEAAARLAQ